MEKGTKRLICSMALLLLAACEKNNSVVPENQLIVVRAYVYAGQPVTDVNLTATLQLDDESESPLPINDAELELIKNDIRYELAPAPGDSGYYYFPGDTLPIAAGDTFRLEISYQDQLLTSETVVPEKPANVSVSTDTLIVPAINSLRDLLEWQRSEKSRTILSWDNEEDEFYYVSFENLESDPQPIDISLPPIFSRIITSPFNSDEYVLNSAAVTHFGKHRLVLYHVNEEYVMLYQTSGQDSRDLNEPFSNIDNGLGVFTAFNSDTVLFYVMDGG